MSEYNGRLRVWINKNGWRRMDESHSYHLMVVRTDGGIDGGSVPTVDEILKMVRFYFQVEQYNDDYVCDNGRRRTPELPSKIERLESLINEFKSKKVPWPEGIY